jgi:uncharacterized protein YukE
MNYELLYQAANELEDGYEGLAEQIREIAYEAQLEQESNTTEPGMELSKLLRPLKSGLVN